MISDHVSGDRFDRFWHAVEDFATVFVVVFFVAFYSSAEQANQKNCLFGSCRSDLQDNTCFDLSTSQLLELERIMKHLISAKYSWTDLYTQCVLSNLLLAIESPLPYDPTFCDPHPPRYSVEEQLSQDALRLLTRYLTDRQYPEPELSSDFDYVPYYVAKRASRIPESDEFVNIHKYLKSHKRGYYEPSLADYYDYGPDYFNDYPGSAGNYLPDDGFRSPYDNPEPGSDKAHGRGYRSGEELGVEGYLKLLQSMTSREIDYLQRLLLDYVDDYSEYDVKSGVDYDGYDTYDSDTALPLLTAQDDGSVKTAEGMMSEEASDGAPAKESVAAVYENMMTPGTDYTEMSREDALLLKQLLEDKLNAYELDSETIRRLSMYVDSMLQSLQDSDGEPGVVQEKLRELIDSMGEYDEQPTVGDDVYSSEDEPVGEYLSEVMPEGTLGDGFLQDYGPPEYLQESGQPEYLPDFLQPEYLEDSIAPEYVQDSVLPESEYVQESMQPENGEESVEQVLDDLPNSKRAPQIESDTDRIEDVKQGPKKNEKLTVVDKNYAYIKLSPTHVNESMAEVIKSLETLLKLPQNTFSEISLDKEGVVSFRTQPNAENITSEFIAKQAVSEDVVKEIKNDTGYVIESAGVGGKYGESAVSIEEISDNGAKYFLLTFTLCAFFALLVIAGIAIYVYQRHVRSRDKLQQLAECADPVTGEPSKDYQDLCRQRMQSKTSEKPEPLGVPAHVTQAVEGKGRGSQSSHSSTSSWCEEPAQTNMDISTGHIVLAYMEDHLANKQRLDEEWESLQAYEAEPNATSVATEPANSRKNRYADVLPYDHSRVVLTADTNVSASDYINASSITDHDPRNPAYIATQGPLPHTVADFWQMVWEQGSVVIVNLTKLTEGGNAMCHRYWPEEGSDLYHIYEVHLVSEHIWCDEYLVRSFYLKNLQTNETRTVTQFHFVAWPDLGIPSSIKVLLDFRRKVNKSYRGRSCPIVVHCSDGLGRTGTYCLIDMVLNRMSKGAKEIDIAATLEHIRDQRMQMVKTKEQFELALASVAEEVNSILKALPSS